MPDRSRIGNPLERAAQLGKLGGKQPEHLDVQASGGLDAQTPERPEDQEPRRSNAQTSKHPDWQRQTCYLPPELRTWLRVTAAASDREISEIIAEALADYRTRRKS